MAKLTMVKALNLALRQEMERDPDVLVIGEDVGVDGGVFRVTEDLHRVFGGTRVIDSPLAEAGIIEWFCRHPTERILSLTLRAPAHSTESGLVDKQKEPGPEMAYCPSSFQAQIGNRLMKQSVRLKLDLLVPTADGPECPVVAWA
jgi:hypothetical protein